MSRTSHSYSMLVSQVFAEATAMDGLCGDRSHIDKCAITDCILRKRVVIWSPDARYSIIHAESPPAGTALRPEPRGQAPTLQSRRFLNEARDRDAGRKIKAPDAPKAVADSTKTAPVGRSKIASNPSALAPSSSNTRKPTAETEAQVKACGRTFTVGPGASTEETVQRFLDQDRIRLSKENASKTVPATTALEQPAASKPTTSVNTAKPGSPPAKSARTTEVNIEGAIKEAVEDLAATALISKAESESNRLAGDEDWELVDRPEEESWVKVLFRKR